MGGLVIGWLPDGDAARTLYENPKRMHHGVSVVDYRCEDGRFFLVSAGCVTISNPDSFSSSERGG